MAKLSGLKALISATPASDEIVTLDGVDVRVRPVTVVEFLSLIGEFPAIKNLFFGAVDGQDFDDKRMIDTLLSDGPEAAAALIAVASGEGRDYDVRQALLAQPDENFRELLAAFVRQTFPKGFQDFFDRAVKLINVMQGRSGDEDDAVQQAA